MCRLSHYWRRKVSGCYTNTASAVCKQAVHFAAKAQRSRFE